MNWTRTNSQKTETECFVSWFIQNVVIMFKLPQNSEKVLSRLESHKSLDSVSLSGYKMCIMSHTAPSTGSRNIKSLRFIVLDKRSINKMAQRHLNIIFFFGTRTNPISVIKVKYNFVFIIQMIDMYSNCFYASIWLKRTQFPYL
jgi:hypothetical protein